jgi:hypothetical protein
LRGARSVNISFKHESFSGELGESFSLKLVKLYRGHTAHREFFSQFIRLSQEICFTAGIASKGCRAQSSNFQLVWLFTEFKSANAWIHIQTQLVSLEKLWLTQKVLKLLFFDYVRKFLLWIPVKLKTFAETLDIQVSCFVKLKN